MSDGTNGWSDKKIKKLMSDVEISKIYSLCHVRAYEHYKKIFNITTMIVAILGGCTTILEGANILLEERYIGIGIAVLICSALTGVIAQYINSKDPSQLAASHQEMSKGYNRIILDIESVLVNTDDESLGPSSEYINSVTKTLIDLATGGQILPTFIWNQIQKEINSGLLKPDEYWAQTPELNDIRETILESETPTQSSQPQLHQQPNPEEVDIDIPSVEVFGSGSRTTAAMVNFQTSRFGY
jgi:hypothetical protein